MSSWYEPRTIDNILKLHQISKEQIFVFYFTTHTNWCSEVMRLDTISPKLLNMFDPHLGWCNSEIFKEATNIFTLPRIEPDTFKHQWRCYYQLSYASYENFGTFYCFVSTIFYNIIQLQPRGKKRILLIWHISKSKHLKSMMIVETFLKKYEIFVSDISRLFRSD